MLVLLARLREFLTTMKTARKTERNATHARTATMAISEVDRDREVPNVLPADALSVDVAR